MLKNTLEIHMKIPLLSLLLAVASITLNVSADDEYPVSVKKLPSAVVASVQEYLPGAEIVSAKMDEDDGRRELNLRVEHKGLLLRVEARPDGRIREIDLDRGYRGLGALLGREASLEAIATKEIPNSITDSLSDFFRDSDILSASEGVNGEERFYRVRMRHHELLLRVDITHGGRILDIDTVK